MLATALAGSDSAQAVITMWVTDGDGAWTTGSNWDNGEPVDNTFDVVIDDGDSAVTVDLDADRNIN